MFIETQGFSLGKHIFQIKCSPKSLKISYYVEILGTSYFNEKVGAHTHSSKVFRPGPSRQGTERELNIKTKF